MNNSDIHKWYEEYRITDVQQIEFMLTQSGSFMARRLDDDVLCELCILTHVNSQGIAKHIRVQNWEPFDVYYVAWNEAKTAFQLYEKFLNDYRDRVLDGT